MAHCQWRVSVRLTLVSGWRGMSCGALSSWGICISSGYYNRNSWLSCTSWNHVHVQMSCCISRNKRCSYPSCCCCLCVCVCVYVCATPTYSLGLLLHFWKFLLNGQRDFIMCMHYYYMYFLLVAAMQLCSVGMCLLQLKLFITVYI